MRPPDDDKSSASFLDEAIEVDEAALELLADAAGTMSGGDAAPALRDRLLAQGIAGPRFARYASTVAELLDLDEAAAEKLLEGLDDGQSWGPGLIPGMEQYDVTGGPAVSNAITGFLRLEAGLHFPEHKHLGDEKVLVIQGHFVDGVSGESFGPGDVVPMTAGSAHSFDVVDGGTDLVLLTVVHRGVEIGGVTIGPDDEGL